jgi:hypothetical protein
LSLSLPKRKRACHGFTHWVKATATFAAGKGGLAKGSASTMAHNDISTARNTYESFIRGAKVGTVVVVVIAAFVVWLIS